MVVTDLNKATAVATVVLLNSNMVAILSKATHNKVIHHKAINRVMAVVPDMVEDMAEVDMGVVINNNNSLLRSLVSVPEAPQPLVLVVV